MFRHAHGTASVLLGNNKSDLCGIDLADQTHPRTHIQMRQISIDKYLKFNV